MKINKIIAVEGIDKTGKSTFVSRFNEIWDSFPIHQYESITKYGFPSDLNPIGALIRENLNAEIPNTNVISIQNFLAEFSLFWMNEQYINNKTSDITTNQIYTTENTPEYINYIFDRYILSTLAYNVFDSNDKFNLDYFKTALQNNKFIKLPTDIIYLDLPTDVIIERTLADQEDGINDINDTLDSALIEQRKEAFKHGLNFLKRYTNIHYFENVHEYELDDLIKLSLGKIFK